MANALDPIVIRGSLPTQAMVPGVGKSPWPRRKAAAAIREQWCNLGKASGHGQKEYERFHIVYRYCPPGRSWSSAVGKLMPTKDKPYCPRDRDNATAAAKPAIDGLRDAGVIKDDTHKNVLSDNVEFLPIPKTGPGFLEIVIIPEVECGS